MKLFTNKNYLINTDCTRCGCFLNTLKHLRKHNFVERYIDGERKPAELKPIDVLKKDDILSYK